MAKPEFRTTIGRMKKKSNEPTKTKKAMKTMKNFLSMAALALMGAMMTGCSSEDNFTAQPQQQVADKGNVVTLTTTVGLDASAGTRALTETGVKTFAVGDKIAVLYGSSSGGKWAVSEALTAEDITNGGKSAQFTVTLEDPDKTFDVTYVYPASMVKMEGGGQPNYEALATQDGTLDYVSNHDLCDFTGAWNGDNLPEGTLNNMLSILAITLKNEAGTSDITSGTTKLTVSDGTNTYNVNRSAAEGPIYVAIRPTTSATINIEAINGSQGYCKTLATKTYEASNGYPVSWRMTPATLLSTISSNYTAQDGETLYGKLGSNVKISIADGAKVTLKDVTINGVDNWSYEWAGITCAGDATITLEGTNTVKGFQGGYPGIYVPEGKTLTIEGEGSLNASNNGRSTGIGGGMNMHCGNIVINGGNITATGGDCNAGIGGGEGDDETVIRCGKITINGGTVTATGGLYAAGIGGGDYGASNDITINGGIVTATGGLYAAGIGSGADGADGCCGAINISGGTVTATGGMYAAGIGGGDSNGTSGTITIKSTVTKVTATKGEYAPNSIGAGDSGKDITVDIEAGANVIQN